MITIQRVYEHRTTRGKRFLVERLWPRGIRKDALHFSDWLKDAAPSASLRRWFGHEPPRWPEFQRRYRSELDEHPAAWAPILAAARAGNVVLLCSARDTERNSAIVLRDYVNEKLARSASERANDASAGNA